MSFLETETHRKIQSFPIEAKNTDKFFNAVQETHNGENWPVVYLLDNKEDKLLYIGESTCKKQVFDLQFSEKLDSAYFGKQVLHILIDKAEMRQRTAASLPSA